MLWFEKQEVELGVKKGKIKGAKLDEHFCNKNILLT